MGTRHTSLTTFAFLREGVFSINLPNIFSSPRLSVVTRNCLRVAGRPVALLESFILAWLSWVSMRLEYRSCCVVTQRLSFSSPKLAKQLHLQQTACRINKEVLSLLSFYSVEIHCALKLGARTFGYWDELYTIGYVYWWVLWIPGLTMLTPPHSLWCTLEIVLARFANCSPI